MANIRDLLNLILKARYGKDVRQAIHDSIEQCYEDGRAGAIDIQARDGIDMLNNALLVTNGNVSALDSKVTQLDTKVGTYDSKIASQKYSYDYDSNGANYIRTGSGVNFINSDGSEWRPISASNMYIYPNGTMLDIAYELSNKATKAEMNNKGKATFLGTIFAPPPSGQTSVNPSTLAIDLSQYSQIYIEVAYYSGARYMNRIIPKNLLGTTAKNYTLSEFYNTSNYVFTEFAITSSQIRFASENYSGAFQSNWAGIYGIK